MILPDSDPRPTRLIEALEWNLAVDDDDLWDRKVIGQAITTLVHYSAVENIDEVFPLYLPQAGPMSPGRNLPQIIDRLTEMLFEQVEREG